MPAKPGLQRVMVQMHVVQLGKHVIFTASTADMPAVEMTGSVQAARTEDLLGPAFAVCAIS